MSDKEILLGLNEKSRMYINDFYSYLSFFNKNKDKMYNELDDSKYNVTFEEDIKTLDGIIVFSLLFSTIKNDEILSEFFSDFEIDYDFLCQKIKFNDDTNFSCVEFKNALESDMITEVSLSKLFKEIFIKLKYSNYLENEELYPRDIEPYQIFDCLTQDKLEILLRFLEANIFELRLNKDFDIILKDELHEKYKEFVMKNFGFDLDERIEKEKIEAYEFKDCQITIKDNICYLTFKEGSELINIIKFITNSEFDENIIVDRSERIINKMELKYNFINKYKTPCTFIVKKINHSKPDKSFIENFILRKTKIDNIPFEIQTFDNEEYVIWISKTKTLIQERNKDNMDSFPIPNVHKRTTEENESKLSSTPYLDKYGFDLTKDKYIKDPSIGRDDVIKRIEQILLYPERDKSIIITGVAGSGKTALAKGLAYRVQKGDVPKALKNLRIISIDSATLVAGTKYVGTLEEKMKGILDEASQSKDIILFIDEIHQTLGAGVSENDNNSVSEILKPYLDYGRVRVIGATTTEEYEEFVSTNEAFKTRFKKINISEPDNSIIYQILDDLIESYNRLSESKEIFCPKLDISPEDKDMIINWLIESTKEKYRTYNDRCSNPRLVLDIIKEAYAIAAMRDSDIVEIQDITFALSLEERLYKSSREKQIKDLEKFKSIKPKNNIIEFRMIKKES